MTAVLASGLSSLMDERQIKEGAASEWSQLPRLFFGATKLAAPDIMDATHDSSGAAKVFVVYGRRLGLGKIGAQLGTSYPEDRF